MTDKTNAKKATKSSQDFVSIELCEETYRKILQSHADNLIDGACALVSVTKQQKGGVVLRLRLTQ